MRVNINNGTTTTNIPIVTNPAVYFAINDTQKRENECYQDLKVYLNDQTWVAHMNEYEWYQMWLKSGKLGGTDKFNF